MIKSYKDMTKPELIAHFQSYRKKNNDLNHAAALTAMGCSKNSKSQVIKFYQALLDLHGLNPSTDRTEEIRVMCIGDLHNPFCLKGYLEFCQETYIKYNCNKVIFAGDIIDSHYSSYHETDADGLGGRAELEMAISRLQDWYDAFPNADVTLGNHDRMVIRKAQTSNIPSQWIKDFSDVLETPNWNFVADVYYDGVRYTHGDKSGKARTAAKRDMVSTVSGHHHTDMYCEWFFGKTRAIFAMAVGCGIDSKSYAMGYMQGGKKEAIGVGVVIGGHTAFNVKMTL